MPINMARKVVTTIGVPMTNGQGLRSYNGLSCGSTGGWASRMPARGISRAAFTAGRRNAHRAERIATTTSVSAIDTVNRGGFELSLVMGQLRQDSRCAAKVASSVSAAEFFDFPGRNCPVDPLIVSRANVLWDSTANGRGFLPPSLSVDTETTRDGAGLV